MNDLDHVFNDVLAVASQGQSAQFVSDADWSFGNGRAQFLTGEL